MAHHRYPTLCHTLNYIFVPIHSFEFHCARARAHKNVGRVQGSGDTFPKGEKRHVRDNELILSAPDPPTRYAAL